MNTIERVGDIITLRDFNMVLEIGNTAKIKNETKRIE